MKFLSKLYFSRTSDSANPSTKTVEISMYTNGFYLDSAESNIIIENLEIEKFEYGIAGNTIFSYIIY